jgi:chromosome segregation ATPase
MSKRESVRDIAFQQTLGSRLSNGLDFRATKTMTNSREMAEQAFSLLQSALEASETRCRELSAQFEAERPPQSQLETELKSLAARLARVEDERAQWRKTANQLQDVVANERAKLKRIEAKLDVAEGGDEKTSRKEINFWRQKADEFAEKKSRYQERIAALKNELHASQDELERVQQETQASDSGIERLRELLEEREHQIMQLAASLESSTLSADSHQQRVEEQARTIESLSQQLMETECARNEACRAYDLFDAEVRDLRVQCGASEQIIGSLRHDLEHAQTKLAARQTERDTVISSLEAQHESEISELRTQTENALSAMRSEHDSAIASLALENESNLAAAQTLNEQALTDAETRLNDAIGELQAQHQAAIEEIQERHATELLEQSSAHAAALEQADGQRSNALEEINDRHTNEIEQLKAMHAQELEDHAAAHTAALESVSTEHAAALTDLEAQFRQELADAENRQSFELEELRSANESAFAGMDERFKDELAEVRAQHQAALYELESQHQNTLTQLKTNHQQQTDELSASAQFAAAELEALYANKLTDLEAQLIEAREQVAGLDHELNEEKLRAENLNELANEKREEATLMTEKFEEMQERYEETKWKLGRAKHFEKLVRRRKKLIGNLISTIRARQKANNTLKAGLDSLRKYKATADQRQQELLRKIETLENALSEARERIGQHQAKRPSDNLPSPSVEDTGLLRKQVSAQAEIIENLETDLKRARRAENEMRTKSAELERLHDDIATKNTFIGTLQKDIEEKQRAQAQLRKRDIELRKLTDAVAERDRQIASLNRENDSLRSATGGDAKSFDRTQIVEYEKSINQMSNTIEEYRVTIATLNEAVDKWKRKYEFLAADAPYGYDSATGK